MSEKNKKQIYIPIGFGHAFLTLEDNTQMLYKLSNYYDKESSRTIAWNDKLLNINWGIETPVLSENDKKALEISDCDIYFE